MKYKFMLESKAINGASVGGNLMYAFREKHPGSYVFYDML